MHLDRHQVLDSGLCDKREEIVGDVHCNGFRLGANCRGAIGKKPRHDSAFAVLLAKSHTASCAANGEGMGLKNTTD